MAKFKIGDAVRIKKDLQVGACYFNEDGMVGDKFTSLMRNNLGEETVVVDYSYNGGYILDVDSNNVYYDDMLEIPVDDFAIADYKFNFEVEMVVRNAQKEYYEGLINDALDNKMHLTDPEGFQKLADIYKSYI